MLWEIDFFIILPFAINQIVCCSTSQFEFTFSNFHYALAPTHPTQYNSLDLNWNYILINV